MSDLLEFVAMNPFCKRSADLPVFEQTIPFKSRVLRDPAERADFEFYPGAGLKSALFSNDAHRRK